MVYIILVYMLLELRHFQTAINPELLSSYAFRVQICYMLRYVQVTARVSRNTKSIHKTKNQLALLVLFIECVYGSERLAPACSRTLVCDVCVREIAPRDYKTQSAGHDTDDWPGWLAAVRRSDT